MVMQPNPLMGSENMKMCSDNHNEIVFEGGHYVKCPLCEALNEIKELEKLVV